jgi:hypothetical protein
MSTFLENALAPITDAAKKLQLSDAVLEKIKQPEHVLERTLTITLDTTVRLPYLRKRNTAVSTCDVSI